VRNGSQAPSAQQRALVAPGFSSCGPRGPTPIAHGQFGVDPWRSGGSPTGDMDLANHVGQPGMTDRPGRRLAAASIRRSPIRRPPTPELRSAPEAPRKRSPRSPRTVFWGHHLSLQQLISPADHRKFVLQLGDPPTSRPQLGLLRLLRPAASPRSIASCRRQLLIVCADTPRSSATDATGLPAATRSRTRRRNSDGYRFGMSDPPSRVSTHQIQISRLLETRGTSEPARYPGRFIASASTRIRAAMSYQSGAPARAEEGITAPPLTPPC
jgi:hypothetical protein